MRVRRVIPALLFPVLLNAAGCASAPPREKIPEALTARVRSKQLAARDQPLAVGAAAPAVPGLTPVTTAIVFYRGHW